MLSPFVCLCKNYLQNSSSPLSFWSFSSVSHYAAILTESWQPILCHPFTPKQYIYFIICAVDHQSLWINLPFKSIIKAQQMQLHLILSICQNISLFRFLFLHPQLMTARWQCCCSPLIFSSFPSVCALCLWPYGLDRFGFKANSSHSPGVPSVHFSDQMINVSFVTVSNYINELFITDTDRLTDKETGAVSQSVPVRYGCGREIPKTGFHQCFSCVYTLCKVCIRGYNTLKSK